MGVEPQVDDVADAQRVDVGQLRLGRLTGCGYPVIEPSPVVYGFRVRHHSLDFSFSGRARRGTRLTGADSFPRRSKSCLPRASSVFEVALLDNRASFSQLSLFHFPYQPPSVGWVSKMRSL